MLEFIQKSKKIPAETVTKKTPTNTNSAMRNFILFQ